MQNSHERNPSVSLTDTPILRWVGLFWVVLIGLGALIWRAFT